MPHLNDDLCDIELATLCQKEIEYGDQEKQATQPYLFSLDECLVVAHCLDEDQLKLYELADDYYEINEEVSDNNFEKYVKDIEREEVDEDE